MVDLEDYATVNQFRWHCQNGYAIRYEGGLRIPMQRFLLGLAPDDTRLVDHKNRDRADNRRENLAAVSHAENMRNRPVHKGSRSRYRGVIWERQKRKWRAQVKVEGRRIHLGMFDDERKAGEAAYGYLKSIGWPVDPLPEETAA